MAPPDLTTESSTWLPDDICRKLAAIQPPHAHKKTGTIVRLAYARANEEPVKAVFDQPETCNETIWYNQMATHPGGQSRLRGLHRAPAGLGR
jgi:hypothetical protein